MKAIDSKYMSSDFNLTYIKTRLQAKREKQLRKFKSVIRCKKTFPEPVEKQIGQPQRLN